MKNCGIGGYTAGEHNGDLFVHFNAEVTVYVECIGPPCSKFRLALSSVPDKVFAGSSQEQCCCHESPTVDFYRTCVMYYNHKCRHVYRYVALAF